MNSSLTDKRLEPAQELGNKASIVLPTYNGACYLRESIDSCLNQTYRNIELVIVDDGSMDGTASIVASYSDDRIKYIKHETNKGLPRALNTGFAYATGEYLTWTSDDNLYAPEAIATMVNYLVSHPGVDFVYMDFYRINEHGKITRTVRLGNADALFYRNCVGACFLFTREVYEVTGEFNPLAFMSEDYEYWLRVSKRFRIERFSGQSCYYYREHSGSLASGRDHRKAARLRLRMRQSVFAEELRNDRVLRAKLHIATAYDFDRASDKANTRRHILIAIRNQPGCLFNRSVFSTLVKSL